jgi:hypothetical protein
LQPSHAGITSGLRDIKSGAGFLIVDMLAILLVCLALGISPVLALTQYQALATVKGFADSFLAPHNVDVAREINR